MAIHVQDEEADWLIREFARRRGLGITAALKVAVKEASLHEGDRVAAFLARIEPVRARSRLRTQDAQLSSGDKQFMDELWGEMD